MKPKIVLPAVAVVLTITSVLAQEGTGGGCPYFLRTAPVILLNDGSNSIRMEISAGPGATGVTWRPLNGSPFKVAGQSICGGPANPSFTLHDDGQGGDLKAGDGIFTLDGIQFDPNPQCQVVGRLLESSGAMAGWNEYNPGTIAIKTASGETDLTIAGGYYIPLIVVEAQMYRALDNVAPIDAGTQQTAWLINVRDDNLQVERGMNNLSPVLPSLGNSVAALSSALTDGYDFRALVSTTTTACDLGRTQGIHLSMQSSVTGIGSSVFNNSKVYQAGPRLLGINFIASFRHGDSGLYYHETMHQWGAYLSTQLGVGDGTHWVEKSSVAGALGGCPWIDNGDGTFSTTSRQLTDGDLELYVAGLLAASQVGPSYVASANITNCNAGQLLQGPYKKVTVNDVIAAHGPRVPAFDGSIKTYKHALVVTSQNRLLTPLEMTYFGRVAQMWEGSTIEPGSIPPLQWPAFTRGASAFNMVLDTWNGPLVRAVNITNAASGKVAAVSPGEIIVLYGGKMGPASLSGLSINGAGFVDTVSGGTRVLFDGIPAPMLYSSTGQVSAIVPYEVAGRVAVSVQVEYQGQRSPAVSLPVTPAAPAIFTQDQSGRGAGSIRNQDYSLNTASDPAVAGSVIQIYGTGEGVSVPLNADGAITPDLRSTQQTPSVSIGGMPATVQFAGPAPQAVAGLFQVNAFVPAGLPAGAVPVTVSFGTAPSQAGVTVFVK